jgi:uncharacterized protein DUF6804
MMILSVLATSMVVLGLVDMPYGFYTLLRVILCLTAAVGFAAARRRDDLPWTWAYGALAVLYNPVLPVHLGAKGLWILVNAGTLVVYWVGAMRFRGVMSAFIG